MSFSTFLHTISIGNWLRTVDLDPPHLLIYAIAVALSSCRSTDKSVAWLAKAIKSHHEFQLVYVPLAICEGPKTISLYSVTKSATTERRLRENHYVRDVLFQRFTVGRRQIWNPPWQVSPGRFRQSNQIPHIFFSQEGNIKLLKTKQISQIQTPELNYLYPSRWWECHLGILSNGFRAFTGTWVKKTPTGRMRG